jgi:hypothetical protein
MGVHVGSRTDRASGGDDPTIDKTVVKACPHGAGSKNIRAGDLGGQGKTIFFDTRPLGTTLTNVPAPVGHSKSEIAIP